MGKRHLPRHWKELKESKTNKNMEIESILLPGIEAKRPIVIAGPCSAETEEQVMDTAKQLAAKGQKIYRAGIWKPRTKPGGFEGIGENITSALKLNSHNRLPGIYNPKDIVSILIGSYQSQSL